MSSISEQEMGRFINPSISSASWKDARGERELPERPRGLGTINLEVRPALPAKANLALQILLTFSYDTHALAFSCARARMLSDRALAMKADNNQPLTVSALVGTSVPALSRPRVVTVSWGARGASGGVGVQALRRPERPVGGI